MSQYKILIVEDDPMISESLADIVRVLGHEVVGIADNAVRAIELCSEQEPQIALLDIQIGGDVDGVDLAEMINDEFDIPFIFTTAFADTSTIARARERGPFGYLVKPYGVKDLNAAIEVAMGAFQRLKKAEKKGGGGQIIDRNIFLKVDSKLVRVKIDDILYIEAKGDYALFKTKQKRLYRTWHHEEVSATTERLQFSESAQVLYCEPGKDYRHRRIELVDRGQGNTRLQGQQGSLDAAVKLNVAK